MPLLIPAGAGSLFGCLPVTLGYPVLEELTAFRQCLPFGIQIDLSVTELLQVCEYNRILHGILVPVQVALLHVVGNGVFQSIAFLSFFPAYGHIYHPLDIVAVEAVFGKILWIRQGLGSLLQHFLGSKGKWRIHVQLEVGHDKQLVPQFMLKIRDIPEMGLQISHDTYYGLCHLVALLAVFNSNRVVYHFLEMPAVLGYEEMGTFRVVFEIRC